MLAALHFLICIAAMETEMELTVGQVWYLADDIRWVARTSYALGFDDSFSFGWPSNPGQVVYEFKSLRSQYKEAKTLPAIEESYVFLWTSYKNTNLIRRSLDNYIDLLRKQRSIHARDEKAYDRLLEYYVKLYYIWDDLDSVQSTSMALFSRRKALSRLKSTLGEDHFKKGIMPFPFSENGLP